MVINVTKINAEAYIAKTLLEKNKLTFDDLKSSKEIRDEFVKQTGMDLSVFSFPGQFDLFLDISKVMAMDSKVIDIPGIPGLRGFSIWFDHEVGHCWWLTEDCYERVKDALNSY